MGGALQDCVCGEEKSVTEGGGRERETGGGELDLASGEREGRGGVGKVDEFGGFGEVGGFGEEDEWAVHGELAGLMEGKEVDCGGEGGGGEREEGVGLEGFVGHGWGWMDGLGRLGCAVVGE